MDSPDEHPTIYNKIAGESVDRLAALSDGIFGVAMTLLLLDLQVPSKALNTSDKALLSTLLSMFPEFFVYLMSFITLSIFWVGQQTQLNNLSKSDRHLTWIHLAFLFMVTILPFSTRLLADFITYRTALICYWLNILALGLLLYICWERALKADVVRMDMDAHARLAVRRRIVGAQLLYALGAAFCVVNTYLSIGFIVLVQLNFAVAPKIRWLSKI